ncbi:MAG: PASTA domain-containing protein [Oscillospiraceae bacterium]|jgi:stage V sporulation protein D (sporulation-specific penicillin-binding protein)|nr:PASTA domain-containing protein [Oscillospiraceae bacterium]
MSFTKIDGTKARINGVMFILLFVCFGGLVLRLTYFQIVQHESYKKMVEKQYMTIMRPKPKRGSIFDRNGVRLAGSANVWDVVIAPGEIPTEKKKRIAVDLADLLDEDKERMKEILKRKTRWAVLKRSVEKDLADKVRAYEKENNASITLAPSSKRYYIRKDFLATVLGFVGQDGQGLEGLEKFYENELKGSDGKIIASANAWGTSMPDSTKKEFRAENGNSLVLTIDAKIQEILEKHLAQAVLDYSVKNRAVGIIMDANTGEILAMATKPDFDPNKPFDIFDEKKRTEIAKIKDPDEHKKEIQKVQHWQWRNKAVADPYEPGSVFKIITAASALEEGTTKTSDHFRCSGRIKVGDKEIECWERPKEGGHGSLSFDDALIESCNPAFAQIGLRLGKENFNKYFEAFGFGPNELTGVDLPGEAPSIFHKKSTFGEHALAVSSIGQTFKTTPIQLLTGVTAAVNGGKLVRPHIVKRIVDEHGNVVKSNDTTIKRQVISSEVSEIIALDCEKIVSWGHGRSASRKGYRIGGKTGTAQKVDKQVEGKDDEYVLSFWAFTPVENPRISILVLLDEPQVTEVWGSVIAAPVVGRILEDLFRCLNMEPTYSGGGSTKSVSVTVPNLEGENVSKAKEMLKKSGLRYRVSGNEQVVVGQLPAAQVSVPPNSIVTLYTELEKDEINKIEVPDVVGKSISKAEEILSNKGLNFIIKNSQEIKPEKGRVIVTKQEPAAGERVDPGKVIDLEFIYSADADVR